MEGGVREVSASSSLLRLILSLRPSASRRDAVIFACICSPLISAILTDRTPEGERGQCQLSDKGREEGNQSSRGEPEERERRQRKEAGGGGRQRERGKREEGGRAGGMDELNEWMAGCGCGAKHGGSDREKVWGAVRERERNRLTDTDSQKERKKQEKKNKIKEKQATVGFSRLFRSSGWLRQRQKGCYGYDMDMDMPCLVLSRRPSK